MTKFRCKPMPKTISDILGCASPTNVREPDDFYCTPTACTEALILAEGGRIPTTGWDPFCGNGDISSVIERSGRRVLSTDLRERGYGRGGIDFLRLETPLTKAIVTNPPFKHAVQALRHAAALGIEYLAFLHKAIWLNYQQRADMAEFVWCPVREWKMTWRPDFKNQKAPPWTVPGTSLSVLRCMHAAGLVASYVSR